MLENIHLTIPKTMKYFGCLNNFEKKERINSKTNISNKSSFVIWYSQFWNSEISAILWFWLPLSSIYKQSMGKFESRTNKKGYKEEARTSNIIPFFTNHIRSEHIFGFTYTDCEFER